jgi:hypothetical protein
VRFRNGLLPVATVSVATRTVTDVVTVAFVTVTDVMAAVPVTTMSMSVAVAAMIATVVEYLIW